MWTSFHQSHRSSNRGFTLIEMLVVMGIMMMITTVLLVNQSRFNSSTILRSLAYSVALSVRQAQVYGTSVAGTTTASGSCNTSAGGFYTGGNCYASAFGLHFDISANTTYTLFADLNSDGMYTTSPPEFIKSFAFSPGYVISDICAVGVAGTRCSPGTINTLDIIFKRPNPDANFTALFNGSPILVGGVPDTYSSAYIQIQSTADPANTKRITILNTGEVSVCSTVGC
jgi:prepilin-type N-terminal cleavage/methylation domain-containing protein